MTFSIYYSLKTLNPYNALHQKHLKPNHFIIIVATLNSFWLKRVKIHIRAYTYTKHIIIRQIHTVEYCLST